MEKEEDLNTWLALQMETTLAAGTGTPHRFKT